MLNTSLACSALVSAIAFYVILDDAIQSRPAEAKVMHSWYCDGWAGVKYPNENSMRKAMK